MITAASIFGAIAAFVAATAAWCFYRLGSDDGYAQGMADAREYFINEIENRRKHETPNSNLSVRRAATVRDPDHRLSNSLRRDVEGVALDISWAPGRHV